MDNSNLSFIRADGNKIINEKMIRWIKQMDLCLEVCTKSDGCSQSNVHKICKLNNPDSYDKLNKLFQQS